MPDTSQTNAQTTPEQARIAQLEKDLAAAKAQLTEFRISLDRLRRAYTHALEELQLMRRRLYVAKAERIESSPEQLEFDAMVEKVRALETALTAAEKAEGSDRPDPSKNKISKSDTTKPTGRRDLADSSLPVVRVEIVDPELEGVAERIGFEESSRLGFERGGMRHIISARVVYKMPSINAAGNDAPTIRVTPLPKELFKRCLLAPSLLAHLLTAKYVMGVPFYRLEQKLALEGASLDRGTMSRYAENAGATLGAIVEAARAHAFKTAFCLSTDATGVSIQPGPLLDGDRRPCRKGHFFVVLADRDHVFFEYQERHTSAVVSEMFQAYSGYIQSDAHSVYDALFREKPPDPERGPPVQLGCWSHARRYFWEAAVCKQPLGLDGLRRIDAIFAMDRLFADMPPSQRKERRNEHVRPLLDAFFHWVRAERAAPRERGLVSSALGYSFNQEEQLRRFLEDGRLRLDNNGAERQLRTIATGRKAWLFFGSDDHATAAGNLFSLIASCKLHGLDPESYLCDVIRVMPYWPRERYLELAPLNWVSTRARLDQAELARPIGHVTVPPEQKSAPS